MDRTLFESDWCYILDTIYRINNRGDLESFQRETLDCLRKGIPFYQGIFHVYRTEGDETTFLVEPVIVGAPALYFDEFNERFSEDSFFSKCSVASRDKVFRDTDRLPDEERMRLPWYREIYARQGIHYALRAHLVDGNAIIGSIDLFRQRTDRDFSQKDVRILETLACHISQKLAGFLPETSAHPIGRDGDIASGLAAKYRLTARERDVVRHLVSGKEDKDVADALCISVSTLHKHIQNIYRKVGVNSRSAFFAVYRESERAN